MGELREGDRIVGCRICGHTSIETAEQQKTLEHGGYFCDSGHRPVLKEPLVFAAMRSGAPPQEQHELQAMAESLEDDGWREGNDKLWRNDRFGGSYKLENAFQRLGSNGGEVTQEQVGAPRLDLTREEAEAVYECAWREEGVNWNPEFNRAAHRTGLAKLRAFLAGAPPEEGQND